MGECEFGRGDSVSTGSVHDNDTTLGGGIDIDVVHADTGATNNLEERRSGENSAADLRFGTHRDGMHILYEFQNLLRRRPVSLNDFKARLLTQVGNSLR